MSTLEHWNMLVFWLVAASSQKPPRPFCCTFECLDLASFDPLMLKPDVQNRHEDQPISSDKPWSNNPARDLVLYPW